MMDSSNNNQRRCITLREVVHIDYWSTLPQDLLPLIVSHWDVATLIDKKRVCRDWKDLCIDAINAKRTETTQVDFSTNEELKRAVKQYCGYNENTHEYSQRCSREDAEEIATAYGWPINKWDVSSLQDLSGIFYRNRGFNEDIGLWNTSSAKSMRFMFFYANTFDQDISSWNVSNVTDMQCMFRHATSFNQDISLWDTSNVEDMSWMFCNATSFNQDISLWDTWSVLDMSSMFQNATSFNQNISQRDTSSVEDMQGMFNSATSFQQDVSSWGNGWDMHRF
jgi:surface protein